MDYKTNWKDFLKYDEHGRRVHDFPSYVVDTAPGEKNYMYHGEYEAMLSAEKAVKNARRAAREAELAASRPDFVNSQVTSSNSASATVPHAAVLAGRRGDPPDLERHSRKCLICSHPDRDAIEGEFIRWRSPHKIARDYDVTDRNSIYRHAHATNLFEERRRHVARVLESYLETIDDNPPADFDPVTRAVRVYAHLNTSGGWFEPLRKVHITTSHIHTSNPAPDPNLELEPEPHLNLDIESDSALDNPAVDRALRVEAPDFSQGSVGLQAPRRQTVAERRTSVEPLPRSDRSDSSPDHSSRAAAPPDEIPDSFGCSQVPVGTTESSPVRECGESVAQAKPAAPAAHTSSPELRDCPSRESTEGCSSPVTNTEAQNLATREEESQLRLRPSAASQEKPLGAVAPARCGGANRDNPGIKTHRNQQQTNHIPKANRDKNASLADEAASPHLR